MAKRRYPDVSRVPRRRGSSTTMRPPPTKEELQTLRVFDRLRKAKAKKAEPNDRLSFYGRSRIRSFLEGLPRGSTPSDLVSGLYQDAKRFSEGAESTDDIAIVAIQYVG